jgi:hypothetical protein
MRRAIEKFIENPLAEYLLRNQDGGTALEISMVEGLPKIKEVEAIKKKVRKVKTSE